MIQDEMLKGFLVGQLGMSDEDLAKITPEIEEELRNIGSKAGRYRVVAEVVSSKYCSAGLKPGHKYVIAPGQQINLGESTAPLCLGALAPLGQRMGVYLDRMAHNGDMTASMQGFRCTDPGLGKGGLGTVEFKVYIEEVQ
ncbi:MAG: hypothetical protein JRH06_13725 [Deltaproteobacteria bacterium]|nr:hypothetical protein [Deltaproteobacteria bacterium]MBW2031287.1 hypothetical protein [Deltaproteobacteria bacterium]MBW2138602.1 hypothetical protein [Deltaproteobacteria bacterium]